MNNYQTIELNSSELESIDGGFIEAYMLYAGAAYLSYEIGYAIGKGVYHLTH